MQYSKALPTDPETLLDPSVDSVERIAALSRLVSDQRREFEPFIAKLLVNPEPVIRAKSILSLVGRWQIENYVGAAVQMLTDDPDELARSNAAQALSMFAGTDKAREQDRLLILRALTRLIKSDKNEDVQEAAYEAILQLLKRPANEYFHERRSFDSKKDVNWELLSPYL